MSPDDDELTISGVASGMSEALGALFGLAGKSDSEIEDDEREERINEIAEAIRRASEDED